MYEDDKLSIESTQTRETGSTLQTAPEDLNQRALDYIARTFNTTINRFKNEALAFNFRKALNTLKSESEDHLQRIKDGETAVQFALKEIPILGTTIPNPTLVILVANQSVIMYLSSLIKKSSEPYKRFARAHQAQRSQLQDLQGTLNNLKEQKDFLKKEAEESQKTAREREHEIEQLSLKLETLSQASAAPSKYSQTSKRYMRSTNILRKKETEESELRRIQRNASELCYQCISQLSKFMHRSSNAPFKQAINEMMKEILDVAHTEPSQIKELLQNYLNSFEASTEDFKDEEITTILKDLLESEFSDTPKKIGEPKRWFTLPNNLFHPNTSGGLVLPNQKFADHFEKRYRQASEQHENVTLNIVPHEAYTNDVPKDKSPHSTSKKPDSNSVPQPDTSNTVTEQEKHEKLVQEGLTVYDLEADLTQKVLEAARDIYKQILLMHTTHSSSSFSGKAIKKLHENTETEDPVKLIEAAQEATQIALNDISFFGRTPPILFEDLQRANYALAMTLSNLIKQHAPHYLILAQGCKRLEEETKDLKRAISKEQEQKEFFETNLESNRQHATALEEELDKLTETMSQISATPSMIGQRFMKQHRGGFNETYSTVSHATTTKPSTKRKTRDDELKTLSLFASNLCFQCIKLLSEYMDSLSEQKVKLSINELMKNILDVAHEKPAEIKGLLQNYLDHLNNPEDEFENNDKLKELLRTLINSKYSETPSRNKKLSDPKKWYTVPNNLFHSSNGGLVLPNSEYAAYFKQRVSETPPVPEQQQKKETGMSLNQK